MTKEHGDRASRAALLDQPSAKTQEHHASSETKSKFKKNLLGGLHDGSLQRVVDEAEALEESEEAKPKAVAPKVEEKFHASSATKSKFKSNLLGGLRDGSLERVVDEAEALDEVAAKTEPAAVEAPKEEEHHASSETKSKFKKNLLGGLHDGSLQRVVDEAEALEESEEAKPKAVEEAPKVEEPFHASSETKSKFKKNLLGGLRDGSLERVVDEAEALDDADAKGGAVEDEACAQVLESMEVACVMESEMLSCCSTLEAGKILKS